MFRLDEISGSLIKQGRFKEAITKFYYEIDLAINSNAISYKEMMALCESFSHLLLSPSVDAAKELGDKMIMLAIRLPNYVPRVGNEFYDNIEKSKTK